LEENAEAVKAAEDKKDMDGRKESKPKGKKKTPMEVAAAVAVEETQEKSPTVAEFIEAKEEGDSIKVEVAEVVKPKRGIAKPSFEYKSNFFSLS
jgi:hypothetical protein